jgi:hypothetical protein
MLFIGAALIVLLQYAARFPLLFFLHSYSMFATLFASANIFNWQEPPSSVQAELILGTAVPYIFFGTVHYSNSQIPVSYSWQSLKKLIFTRNEYYIFF